MKRILAGPHAVNEALRVKPGAIEVICVVESMRPTSVRRIEETARRSKVPMELLSREAVDQLAGKVVHQGVVAVTGSYPYIDLDGLLARAAEHPHPLIVVLDQIQDPRNLGAIMRSVHAFGGCGLIILKDRAAGVTAAVVRASAGASELVLTTRVTNLVRTLDRLRDEGYQVYGASTGDSTRVAEISWRGRTALVLGSEGRGLRRLTTEHCDRLFTIPLAVDFDSLNVSAAAAIALYEASRQRFTDDDAR